MILELTVENIAIIEKAQLELDKGFTALTGETGAGKSLLIDAIDLVLGGRADSECVRTGATKGTISLVANIRNNHKAKQTCEELGVPLEEDQIYIQREIQTEGRSICRIGGKQTPVSMLKNVGTLLVDIHGQHDHQSLLDPNKHLECLDEWIGQPALDLLNQVGISFNECKQLRNQLEQLQGNQREREQRMDMLHYQIQEIESIDPKPGELIDLESKLNRLRNAEKLAESTYGILNILDNTEGSVREKLASCVKTLQAIIRMDASLEAPLNSIEQTLFSLDEGIQNLNLYSNSIDDSPEALDETIQRIDNIKRLLRKYGDTEEKVLEFLISAKEDLHTLENIEMHENEYTIVLEKSEQKLEKIAEELTHLRKLKAAELGLNIQEEIQDLAMPNAKFEISIRPKNISQNGANAVEFLFSANPGEELKPLNKIGSGGEIARVMLALKVCLAGKVGVPTLIFDEVDTGLSGRAAAKVAKKLEELAQHYQVIVISHLPQIASSASAHYKIEKEHSKGRVMTTLRLLTQKERIEEVARMLAGEEIGEHAIANAKELLHHTDLMNQCS